ncbi:hypothetical protein C4552_04090 [Candidatus Parcubacteria bacterium]|nr:MAG: hypothetical protein C4552_04090 [Candidatus Parcubacteria bacterium]
MNMNETAGYRAFQARVRAWGDLFASMGLPMKADDVETVATYAAAIEEVIRKSRRNSRKRISRK